jgi:hypothetical protein
MTRRLRFLVYAVLLVGLTSLAGYRMAFHIPQPFIDHDQLQQAHQLADR